MSKLIEKLTVEELNLMSIYDTSSIDTLLSDLVAARKDVYDSEMLDIFDSAIRKLESCGADEFDEISAVFANSIF